MRHSLSIPGLARVPQVPGHGTGWRASGTTQCQRCPGAEDPASHRPILCASGTTKRSAREEGNQK
jgi:hypothetical protein